MHGEITKEKGKSFMDKRDYSLDLVRIFAVVMVVSNHFFLLNGFYYEIVQGKRMYALNLMRTFSLTCVPLFLVLTGYLMCQKTLSRTYYRGICKTICIYLLSSVSCIIYANIVSPGTYEIKNAILDILGFKAADYSWYIEMYIGLFLLIPFLNLIYQNLRDKRQKQCLIVTLLILTALPGITNIYNFYMDGWWKTPSLSTDYQKIIPAYWISIFPLTYYFIGCYLRENEVKLKRKWNLVWLLCCILVFGSFCFYRYYNGKIVEVAGEYQDWGAVLNVVQTVLLFVLLTGIKGVNRLPSGIKRIIKYLSDLTLGAYLVSSIFDSVFYPKLNEAVKEVPHKLEYYFTIVPAVLVCSFLLSAVINFIYRILGMIVAKAKAAV